MAVYMIRAGARGDVKIGLTNDPARRLRGLQTGHAESLCLIRVLDGGAVAEKALHGRFSVLRKTGEWFTFAPEMLGGDIGFADLPIPVGKRALASAGAPALTRFDGPVEVQTLIDRAGGVVRLAALTGLARTTIIGWRKSGSIPGWWVVTLGKALKLSTASLFELVPPPKPRAKRTPESAAPPPLTESVT
jgi:hypothetical protein